MHFVFLLGSGISIAAGMPSVCDIGDEVFSGDGVVRRSDGVFDKAPANEPNYEHYREKAQPAIDFTLCLQRRAERYFSGVLDYPPGSVDYEDVANFASQIADALAGEYENPALLPLLTELEKTVGKPAELRDRAALAVEYVRDTVWRMLGRRFDRADYLRAITEACNEVGSGPVTSVDLFELNHDLVLEAALRKADVDASDGFTDRDGDVDFWANHFPGRIRHFKLHGSIDWFDWPTSDERRRRDRIGRPTTNDIYHATDARGCYFDIANTRPAMLVGTFDKALGYGSGIFADQHGRLHESMRCSGIVIVIGYGFRDKAINARLIDWLGGDLKRRLVVVHPEPDKLFSAARPAITRAWESWSCEGRLQILQKKVEDTNWNEIREASKPLA